MKTRKAKIAISELKLDSDFEKRCIGNSSIKKLSMRTSREAMPIILAVLPIVVRESEKGYVVLSGKRTLALVKAIMLPNEKIEVSVLEGATEAEMQVAVAVDDIYGPLLLQSSLDALEKAAGQHRANGAIHRLAIDLSKKANWKEMQDSGPSDAGVSSHDGGGSTKKAP